ncbi:UDP-N-acetylglucosamine--N-acetylmuramyl-(pentapeptide) pyrophosphoryl-undecaprenol N-acetylglucosamine transferase [Microlunatus flavus]|uniref:UDP-N-acetylglucosamine--N-acetylmuramyl-(pentapeptide) pyrophosphoryl-undecaprenol N-acetylglucosamine transferase n=1 Tax=Microlunatus flavus TaxID=1036181 RepID=A0A1H9HFC1_9ACTN|nr:UDP-N-acetylglucosamine--N-acetylmuramyl-(pentapeptide) pyrophosphoryl-undecaprenol N-acetylglucosamine transferase [Microlunatus flavus]SEQ60988.1 UDP-N-acetylglucosamine--N-acetylmuramyl-(pentapeptide) pyrophosphoryl-undecaprenol N-acetylglucosamine transferase [Microlunatus flavus]
MSAPVSVVLAGGGTAGHTSPLIATAQELLRLAPGTRVTAVGTARGLESTVVPAAGLPLELIPPVPMPRRPGPDLLRVPGRLAAAVRAAGAVLRRTEADVALGFGGYVSTPVYLAARRLGVPVVVHEQNALPGLANRLAARVTREVYISFPGTPLAHATLIGLPLRRGIADLDRAAARPAAREALGLEPEGGGRRPTLLVSGGSQGAASVNAAARGAADDLLRAGVDVLHVLGPKNFRDDDERRVDAETGATYVPLAYVEHMEQAYAAADLMLGRCGAGTVMETATVGLPCVFVPYPHGNGEQARNAAPVVEAGGGLLLDDADCTPGWVAAEVPTLLGDPDRLAAMARALAGTARRDAATVLAERTLAVAASTGEEER